jgi:hypothetical protein
LLERDGISKWLPPGGAVSEPIGVETSVGLIALKVMALIKKRRKAPTGPGPDSGDHQALLRRARAGVSGLRDGG